MTCDEARQFYAALIAGELRISEAALVEAHLSRCADCRQIVEGLYLVAPRDSEGRIALAGAGDSRIGAGSRLLLPLLVLVALGASALVAVPGLAPYAWHRATALVVAARHLAPQPTTPTAPPVPEPGRSEPPSGAAPWSTPRPYRRRAYPPPPRPWRPRCRAPRRQRNPNRRRQRPPGRQTRRPSAHAQNRHPACPRPPLDPPRHKSPRSLLPLRRRGRRSRGKPDMSNRPRRPIRSR